MNTTNILNLTSENSPRSLSKNQGELVDSVNKQGDSTESSIQTEESKQTSDFGKTLKESLSSGQKSDSSAENEQGKISEQALPEDGKILPLEKGTELIVDSGTDKFSDELNVKPQLNNSSPENNLEQVEIENGTNSPSSDTVSTISSQNDQIKESNTQPVLVADSEKIESKHSLVEVGPLRVDSTTELEKNKNEISSTLSENILNSNNELQESGTNDPFAQLNFIEQSKNTNTVVGVDPKTVQDSFQNINRDASSFNKITNTIETQSNSDSLSALKNSESKTDSLFSGSLTDQNGTQQGFSQNNNGQANINWIAANSNVQTTVETQTKLIDTETLLIEEKVDTSRIVKSSSEITKTTVSTETITRISEYTVKTPVLNNGWNAEVNNHISYVAKNGGGIAKIKLNPAHLGPVEASIKIASDGVTVQINANHVTTRDALDLGVARLKEMLQEQGFTQVDVNVSDQGLSKGNRESTTEVADATDQSMEGDLEGVDEEVHESTSTKSTINGVVDYYA